MSAMNTLRKKHTSELTRNPGHFAHAVHDADESPLTHPGGYDTVDADLVGNMSYLRAGALHREDGPARVLLDGTEEHYRNGRLHSYDDQPAVVSSTGEREWRRDGVPHRDGDQPAKILADGSMFYIHDGQLDRAGGRPAVVSPNGRTEYWVSGVRHRGLAEGPARIHPDGAEEYWVHGQRVSRR
jgi:hypothetical protein